MPTNYALADMIATVFNNWMMAQRYVICETSVNIGSDLKKLFHLAEDRRANLEFELGYPLDSISFAWADGIIE